MKYSIPRGTYYIQPTQVYDWQHHFRRFQDHAAVYGYSEISTLIFESSGLF